MMRFNIIGCGAAGNKALAGLIEKGFNEEYALFVNSTIKDIPMSTNRAVIFGTKDGISGCGKERNLGRSLLLQDMKNGDVDIDRYIAPDVDATIICGSTEGGSGSASIPVLARYVNSVFKNRRNLNMPVIVVLFFGFNDDARGMQNSIEICQELVDDDNDVPYGVIGICNSKFEDMNKLAAERAANEEFVRIVNILSGSIITESAQNIDDTDLYKLIATPGYMSVESLNIGKIKNRNQYDNAVQNRIDTSKLMDAPSGTASRLGVIFNINQANEDGADFNSTVLKKKYGTPYEHFTHVQEAESGEWICWIAAGQKMPTEEIKEIFARYTDASSKVDKKKDDFFETIGSLRGFSEDKAFDTFSGNERNIHITEARNKKVKDDFFSQFGLSDNVKKSEKIKPSAQTIEQIEEY